MINQKAIDQFTDDQRIAWALLESRENVFITGEAGSGKSYVIRQFMKSKDLKKFPVLASTGAAAVLVGGRTFHSYMGLGIMEGGVDATVIRALEDRRVRKRLVEAEGFIVDEISMLSGPTLQAAEKICQMARSSLEPWGGLRVIAVGDFAQLPPVQQGREPRMWAFLDPVWRRSNFKSVVLRQNMRSGDSEFLEILNDIRRGQVNDRVESFLNRKQLDADDLFEGTRLFPRRNQTDAYNSRELEKLPGEMTCFPASYSGNEKSVEQLKKHSPLPDELYLKDNALVMLRQNDPKLRWVNGSTGYIRQIQTDQLTIELLTGRVITIEPVSFSLMNAEGSTMASVTNFPITLAYAATIHKAQGMTLDRLMVNLNALWEPGQAYVALSRIIDPVHLRIEAWQPQSIKADPVVENFYQSL
ncbi:MAG: AAA family ATPase [Bdellovibrionales bacterium]|nr:AAA family ATPase [Bdellovibrionales bacterium]